MSSSPGSSSFDASQVSRATWIAGGGALVLLISVFLSWYKVEVNIGGFGASSGGSGWETTDLAKLVALLALAALVIIGIELFAKDVTLPFPTSLALIGIGGLSTLIVLLRIIDKPGGDLADAAGFDISLSYGIFIALLAAIAVTVGGYLKMQEPV
jgi:hypothetical protein